MELRAQIGNENLQARVDLRSHINTDGRSGHAVRSYQSALTSGKDVLGMS